MTDGIRCRRCNMVLPLEAFAPCYREYKKGRAPYCRACVKEAKVSPKGPIDGVCQICARPFVSPHSQFTCSSECARVRDDRLKSEQRQQRRALALAVALNCQRCGEVISAERRASKISTKFCSTRCYTLAHAKRHGPKNAAKTRVARIAAGWLPRGMGSPLVIADCGWCGTAYVKRHNRLCCSPECNKQRRLHRHRCGWCDRPCARLWCSDRCLRAREGAVSLIEYGDCQRCGRSFVRRDGWVGQHCSRRCQKASQKRNREHRKRTNVLGAERFDLRQIAERDHWTCGLCGKKVNPRWAVPNPRAATLDHVVPLSLGGGHTRANTQLAHFGCNSAKNNRYVDRGEQLRLIG